MNPQMFREYDIRGIAGEDMDEADVYAIARGIGTYLRQNGCRKIIVGRDCRTTSDAYAAQVIKGLAATGCDVADIGVCPTPVLYFSIHHFYQEGGVMVTASHNPPNTTDSNSAMGPGFDPRRSRSRRSGASSKTVISTTASGTLDNGRRRSPYQRLFKGQHPHRAPLRVGMDAGNGTAGVVAVPLLRELGCEVHDIYCDMDGTLPQPRSRSHGAEESGGPDCSGAKKRWTGHRL